MKPYISVDHSWPKGKPLKKNRDLVPDSCPPVFDLILSDDGDNVCDEIYPQQIDFIEHKKPKKLVSSPGKTHDPIPGINIDRPAPPYFIWSVE